MEEAEEEAEEEEAEEEERTLGSFSDGGQLSDTLRYVWLFSWLFFSSFR